VKSVLRPRHLLASLGFAGALLAHGTSAQEEPASPDTIRAALLFRDWLLCLREDGRMLSWTAKTGTLDAEPPVGATPEPARRLADDGAGLWSVSRSALWSWSDGAHAWTRAADFDAHGEDPQGLVLVGGTPLVVLGSRVLAPTEGREYSAPGKRGKPRETRPLRVLALHAGASTLWIGTGYGEWGGELLGLDIATGQWVDHGDDLHYVTGIVQAAADQLTVSWAMSHMWHCDSLLRIHALDGGVRSAALEREDTYVQGLAWSRFDQALYAIDTGALVSIRDGQITKLGDLDGPIYGPERKAVGVAPGIVAVLPSSEKSVFIVPGSGAPWRWQAGELARLPLEASAADSVQPSGG
jgi:hypothetical protein